MSVCSHFIGRVSRRCTPRSTEVWRAGWPVAVDTRSPDPWRVGAQRSVDVRWRRSQVSSSQRPYPKIRSPECPESWTSVFLLMRVLRKRPPAIVQRSPLKKKDGFSCRHCFPDFSRAELKWLNHFRSRSRHSVDWRGVPFVQTREAVGRSDNLFCWIAVCAPSFVWQWPVSVLFFSCDFVNMSVKQHMLRQRNPYDASAMKFRILFFCRLPNPPLTTPTKPPHTLSVWRCPFSPFFSSGSQPPPTNVFKKNFHHSEMSSCVSRAIVKGSSWVEPGRERNGNVMWQSDIIALAVSHSSCFPCSFFRAVEHHGVQPESPSYHSN